MGFKAVLCTEEEINHEEFVLKQLECTEVLGYCLHLGLGSRCKAI